MNEQPLFAFWEYDQFPYVSYGEIEKFHDKYPGRVGIEGLPGMLIQPTFICTLEQGITIVHQLEKLTRRRTNELERIKEVYKDELTDMWISTNGSKKQAQTS